MIRKKTCNNCAFIGDKIPGALYAKQEGVEVYECRRNPRVHTGETDSFSFPGTRKEDWCGEWKEEDAER